jgi:hypothetical protein
VRHHAAAGMVNVFSPLAVALVKPEYQRPRGTQQLIPDFPMFSAEPACARADPTLFDDENRVGSGKSWPGEREAKRLCRDCPVLEECRAYIDRMEGRRKTGLEGIWAGERPDQRLVRRRRERQRLARRAS